MYFLKENLGSSVHMYSGVHKNDSLLCVCLLCGDFWAQISVTEEMNLLRSFFPSPNISSAF